VLARTASADVTVASSDNGALYIHRVDATRVARVYEEHDKHVVAYGFSDAKTLWVLRAENGAYTIGSIADGKAGPTRALKLTVATPGNEVPTGWDVTPGLVVAGGHVFVTTCLDVKGPAPPHKMGCSWGYMRVDDGADAFSKTPPRDVTFWYGRTEL